MQHNSKTSRSCLAQLASDKTPQCPNTSSTHLALLPPANAPLVMRSISSDCVFVCAVCALTIENLHLQTSILTMRATLARY